MSNINDSALTLTDVNISSRGWVNVTYLQDYGLTGLLLTGNDTAIPPLKNPLMVQTADMPAVSKWAYRLAVDAWKRPSTK